MGRILCRFCGEEKGINAHLCRKLAQAIAVMKRYNLTWNDYDKYCKGEINGTRTNNESHKEV